MIDSSAGDLETDAELKREQERSFCVACGSALLSAPVTLAPGAGEEPVRPVKQHVRRERFLQK